MSWTHAYLHVKLVIGEGQAGSVLAVYHFPIPVTLLLGNRWGSNTELRFLRQKRR